MNIKGRLFGNGYSEEQPEPFIYPWDTQVFNVSLRI